MYLGMTPMDEWAYKQAVKDYLRRRELFREAVNEFEVEQAKRRRINDEQDRLIRGIVGR